MDSTIVWHKASGQGVAVEVARFGDGSFGIYEQSSGTSSLIFMTDVDEAGAIAIARDHLAGNNRVHGARRVGVGILDNA